VTRAGGAGAQGLIIIDEYSGTLPIVQTAIWDAANSNAAMVLSNSNQTATKTAPTNTWRSARATLGNSSGKKYFELLITAHDTLNGWMGGFVNASYVNTSFLGVDTNGEGLRINDGGRIYYNNTNTIYAPLTAATPVGTTVGFAIDFTNARWWVTLDGTNWLAGSGANPATNTNGRVLSVTGTTVYPAFAAFSSSGVADGATLTTVAPFTFTVPSGFTSWE
jgi:hypothetical protein